jgi:hypothetical protein
MPRNSNQYRNNKKKMSAEAKKREAQLVAYPTLTQWESTALIKSDFDGPVIKALRRYSSVGKEEVRCKLRQMISPLAQGPVTTTNGGFFFTLGSFAGSSAYAGNFDQYRIEAITVEFSPMYANMNNVPQSGPQPLIPRLYTCLDYDDVSNPGSIAAVQESGSCIVAPPCAGVVRTLVPHISLGAYNGAFTGYTSQVSPWLDTSSNGIQHYGLKYAIEPGVVSQTALQIYSVEIVGYIAFRSTN